MAQGEGFKHITVTAADEEDVVIRVGASAAAEEEPTPVSIDATGTTPTADTVPAASATPASAAAPMEARPARPSTSTTNRPRKAPAKKRDDYRESTLEDLQSQPMPTAQKAVIIAAVVCIIGAIVYCIAFLG